jgi:hypothetical protein
MTSWPNNPAERQTKAEGTRVLDVDSGARQKVGQNQKPRVPHLTTTI